MDLWSGNASIENEVSAPGSEIYVFSRPYHGESRGGDVHYVSLCAGGVVTRLMLADVAGHGMSVAATSRILRQLMRRFMNSNSQTRLVTRLNRHFAAHAPAGRFATAVIATYLSHQGRLRICNAGHPRPLWYRRADAAWSFVSEKGTGGELLSNLPLGLDTSASYPQMDLRIGAGDLLLFYSDALTEAHSSDGRMLGEEGLRNIVAGLPANNVREFGGRVLREVRAFAGGHPAEDDETIMVMRFSDSRMRIPSVREKLNAYAKLLGLKAV
jgi:sigma-B regulation protein RsbU (phosphoserine phosphatase)